MEEKEKKEGTSKKTPPERFKMPEESLEYVVRLGQAKVLENVLTKLTRKPDLFHKAINAAKTKDKKTFISTLEEAGVSSPAAEVAWAVIVQIEIPW